LSSHLDSKEEKKKKEEENNLATTTTKSSCFKLVDITNLAQVKANGHPNVYHVYQPFAKEKVSKI
jgi:hypothetical protein